MQNKINRRDFIKKSTIAGIGVAMAPAISFGKSLNSKARIGLIGVGLRGTVHLQNLLLRNDIEVPAICDINMERIDIAQKKYCLCERFLAKHSSDKLPERFLRKKMS